MARVFLREKPLADGKASLILDYAVNGQRRKQTLKIYVKPKDQKSRNPILRNAYNEAYKRAELVRLDTEKRLINQEHGLQNPYDQRACFLEYLEKLAATRHHNLTSVCNHVRRYSKGGVPFGDVNEEWVSELQNYLQVRAKLQNVSVQKYIRIVNTCLNLAVQARLERFPSYCT